MKVTWNLRIDAAVILHCPFMTLANRYRRPTGEGHKSNTTDIIALGSQLFHRDI